MCSNYFAQENSTIDTIYYNGNNGSKVIRLIDFKTNGLLTKRIDYNKNGIKYLETSYKYSKRHGPSTLYYENGNVQYTCEYKDNKMYGQRMCYDPAGNVSEGNFIFYNADGTKEREGQCINGKPEGQLKLYRDNKIVMLANFKDGMPHGPTYYYDANQMIRSMEEYKNGNFVNQSTEIYKADPKKNEIGTK